MELSTQDGKRVFAHWLRSGWWPTVQLAGGTELKFNPYHDPRNGQFTFAPGGAARTRQAGFAPGGPGLRMGRGGNSRAFEDPMTLEQTFPGIRQMPGGSIVAVADSFFDITGPATAAKAALIENWTKQVINQIRVIDPTWLYDVQPIATLQGSINNLDHLRWQRATAMLKTRGSTDTLKVETLRFLQQRTDEAYDRALVALRTGKLTPRLSDQEAIGNYVDREVRRDLRVRYSRYMIDSDKVDQCG